MIDVTLIGTSALMPLPERALTAVLMTCNGHSILMDCGEGTQSAARKAGVSLMKADMIALTHYHGDHYFGMPGLLQTMGVLGRTDTLFVTGPKGLKAEMEPILKLARRLPYSVQLIELPSDGIELAHLVHGWPPDARLSPFATEHVVPSQGYSFTLRRPGKFMPQQAEALGVPVRQWSLLQKGESVQVADRLILPEQVLGPERKGLKVVYTGDTRICESLITAARGADLLISEATFGEDEHAVPAAEHGHMTFCQAAEVAAKAGVSELWLAHFSQAIGNPKQYLPNATRLFENTVCGRDGMATTLRFEQD